MIFNADVLKLRTPSHGIPNLLMSPFTSTRYDRGYYVFLIQHIVANRRVMFCTGCLYLSINTYLYPKAPMH